MTDVTIPHPVASAVSADPGSALPDSLMRGVQDAFPEASVQQKAVGWLSDLLHEPKIGRLEILHNYAWVFVAAFVVALVMTPIMRRLAVANGVIDRPSDPRKVHRQPIAYLGGAAVYCGILAGIVFSFLGTAFPSLMSFHPS